MSPPPPTIAAACFVAVCAAVFHWSLGGETFALWVDDLGTFGVAALAAVLCTRARARCSAELRRFWTFLALACAAWALAEAIWGTYELVLDREVPVPSAADVGYLGAIPLAVAALLSHPCMHGHGTHRLRTALDGLVLASALLFLSWATVLGPIWESTDLTAAGGAVAVAYPFGDVVIAFFAVLVIQRAGSEARASLGWLLAGLVLMALTDSAYTYLTTTDAYGSGEALDIGWVAAYLAIALAAANSSADEALSPQYAPNVQLAAIVLPFVPVLAALIVIQVAVDGSPDVVEAASAIALVVLVIARQALLVRDLIATREAADGTLYERLAAAILETRPDGGTPR